MSDEFPKSTGQKQDMRGRTEGSKAHQFRPGQTGNPAGRKPGTRNKFAESFINDFLADWETNGAEAIKQTREKDPASYLRVAASIVPKEYNINTDSAAIDKLLDSIDDKQLDNLIAGLAALGASQAGATDKAEAPIRIEPDIVH